MPARAKPAMQRRSVQTRERLLSAMDDLLKKGPFETITVSDLAARAGVSPASIYQRFDNRDALVAVLLELYVRKIEAWNRADETAARAAECASLRDALITVAEAAWRQIEALRYVMRPAYLYSRLRPDAAREIWSTSEKRALEGFKALLSRFRDDLGKQDLARAASMTAYLMNMMFLGRLLHADDKSSWDLPRRPRAFAEALADHVEGYLAARRGVPDAQS